MPKLSDDFIELRRRLSVSAENCSDCPVDMRALKFSSTDEEMTLRDGNVGETYFFKFDKEKPSDPISTHAQRQLCRVLKVPFPFFIDNRPVERNRIVSSWLTANAPAMGDESLLNIKVREGGIIKVIRAIVPVNQVTLPHYEILDLLTGELKGTVPVDMDLCVGDNRDDLVFHARFLFGEKIDDNYRVGLSITTSELGASDLIIDSFLFHEESKTYLTAQYGKEPYAKMNYGRVQPNEIREMLKTLPDRVMDEGRKYLDAIDAIAPSYPGVERACALLSAKKGLPSKFKRALYLEAEASLVKSGDSEEEGGVQKRHSGMDTLHDFARHAGIVAKEFDINARVKLERAIGSFCGLNFDKK